MSGMHFRALWARARAKRDFFSWINFFCQDGSNEVSHVHGKGREVCFHPDGRTQGARDPEREKRHYQNLYIDDIQYAAGRTICQLLNFFFQISRVQLYFQLVPKKCSFRRKLCIFAIIARDMLDQAKYKHGNLF